MSSIGIFGGSFNPIHKGHVALARQLLRRAQLDEVWFLVSPQNPLKPQSLLLDDNMRLEMARLALKDEPHLVASDYEFHLPRPSYTWNTLQHLSQDYPQHRFTLIIGADNWQLFSRCAFPVLWVLTSDGEVPAKWGRCIKLKHGTIDGD